MPRKKKIKIVLVIIILGIAIISTTVILKNKNFSNTTSPIDKNNKVMKSLSKLVLLPEEIPQFATVSDINQLQNQAFFENAQNNDEVIIFPIAGKAIIYRPSIDKIINIGPITLEQSQEGSAEGNSDNTLK